MMSHTAAVNVGMFFGIRGRVITTSTACTSGSQAIGYAYEAIRSGRQKIMIAGGAEELSVTQAAVFDTLYATSVRNDDPGSTPRPFDRDRDGLVVGEGVASFVLEDLEFAEARGASIIAEVVGFGTNCDARHVTQPTADTMESAMRLALADGELDAGCYRLRQRPWYRDRAWRHRRVTGDTRRFWPVDADQLHEELSRPHDGCLRGA